MADVEETSPGPRASIRSSSVRDARSSVRSSTGTREYARTVTTASMVFIAFVFTSSGPFGCEQAVRAAGPLWTLVGLALTPIIYVVPQIVVVSELATMFPSNQGSVAWVRAAFGEDTVIAYLNAMVNLPSNIIDSAVYPHIFASYFARTFLHDARAHEKQLLSLACIVVGTIVSLISAKAVGNFSTLLTFFIIVPFAILVGGGFGRISWERIEQPRAIYNDKEEFDFGALLSVLLWCYTGWRSLGSLGGEVTSPSVFVRGMLIALFLGELLYLLPLAVAVSLPCPSLADNATAFNELPDHERPWRDGYLVVASRQIYPWLGTLMSIAGSLTGISQFCCCLLVYPRTMWAAADVGWLPRFFAKRSRAGTPWVCVIVHTLCASALTFFDFDVLVKMEMLIASVTYVLSLWAYVVLRYKMPDADRPFRWPQSNVGAILVVLSATLLFVANFIVNMKKWYLVVAALGVHSLIILSYYAVFRWRWFAKTCESSDDDAAGADDGADRKSNIQAGERRPLLASSIASNNEGGGEAPPGQSQQQQQQRGENDDPDGHGGQDAGDAGGNAAGPDDFLRPPGDDVAVPFMTSPVLLPMRGSAEALDGCCALPPGTE